MKLPKCRESPTCRQMSCRLDTLADMQCRDMNEDMSPTCHRHDTTCLQMKAWEDRHDRLRHSLLSEIIKTADYEKTNNYTMKMMMRDDYSDEERRETRTVDDGENLSYVQQRKG